jgi:site-specific DNA-methyltransferase (adenine-specific)
MADLTWSGKHRVDTTQNQLLQTIISYPTEPSTTSSSWSNRLIWGDKQAVLPTLLRDFAASINLIYIDPPFMTGRTFFHSDGVQVAYHDTWQHDLDHYLQWLYETLTLLHALLTFDGSLYLHLDWRVAHYARIMLDEIFGSSSTTDGPGFKNEIIWSYQSGGRPKRFYARKHDTIFLYTKSAQYHFHPERIGERRGSQRRNHMRREMSPDGRTTWTIRSAGRIYTYDEDTLMTPGDVWSDIHHLHQKDPERSGYATQKPEALLERIILASSEEDDLVLDCFCGSGVTPAVAERLGRRWIASDQSELAITTTCNRLLAQERRYPFMIQRVVH